MQRTSISTFLATVGQLLRGDSENAQKELKMLVRSQKYPKHLAIPITDVSRRLEVVHVKVHVSKLQALLGSLLGQTSFPMMLRKPWT